MCMLLLSDVLHVQAVRRAIGRVVWACAWLEPSLIAQWRMVNAEWSLLLLD